MVTSSGLKGKKLSSSNKQRMVITEDSQVDLSLSPSNCGSKFAAMLSNAQKSLKDQVIEEDPDQENLLPMDKIKLIPDSANISHNFELTNGDRIGKS